MSETVSSEIRANVDAVVRRDGLRLSADDYDWLIKVAADLHDDLQPLRAEELRYTEMSVLFSAR